MEINPQHTEGQAFALLSCAKLFKRKSNRSPHPTPPPIPTHTQSFTLTGLAVRSGAKHHIGHTQRCSTNLSQKQRHVGEFVGTKAFLLNVSLRSTLREASVCVSRVCLDSRVQMAQFYFDPPNHRTVF